MRQQSAVEPDQIILDAIAKGDKRALHKLYQTHGLAILNYLIHELISHIRLAITAIVPHYGSPISPLRQIYDSRLHHCQHRHLALVAKSPVFFSTQRPLVLYLSSDYFYCFFPNVNTT